MITRRQTLSLIGATAISATAISAAALFPAVATAMEPPIFSDGGFAIRGYDPVAYFTQSAPTEGVDAHKSEYEGATFKFASAQNKALFDSDPAKYAPQYGGYCAYAVSKGGIATTQPDAWTVHDGKLYLNFNTTVRGIWSEDIPGNISKADANWPSVLN